MSNAIARRARVLVVDDEAEIRHILVSVLEWAGYEVMTAANGLLALSMLDVHLPDVILLDLRMPIMDGFGFRARQLLTPHLATIPVIVVSAEHNLEERAGELRPRSWLAKPFDLDRVVDAVADACAA
jgi:two-component system, chemotaxis family, chemotaxis protein CheY